MRFKIDENMPVEAATILNETAEWLRPSFLRGLLLPSATIRCQI